MPFHSPRRATGQPNVLVGNPSVVDVRVVRRGGARYGAPMTAAHVDDAGFVMAADALQAAYFRGTLADDREQIAGRAAKHRDELARRLELGATSGTAHLRSQVRSLQAELHYLDRLIAKLDHRFAALWTTRILGVQLGKLGARTAFHEQRDEVADRPSVEACVAGVDDAGHLLTGDARKLPGKSVHDFVDDRPLAQLDHPKRLPRVHRIVNSRPILAPQWCDSPLAEIADSSRGH